MEAPVLGPWAPGTPPVLQGSAEVQITFSQTNDTSQLSDSGPHLARHGLDSWTPGILDSSLDGGEGKLQIV
jgi:hypothetical protein